MCVVIIYIFVVGYGESALIHKKRKCIYERDEYISIESWKVLMSRTS